MTQIKRKHHMEGLLVLLLFSVFAVCILSVLLTGADAYKRLSERDDAAYDRRTAVQYIATKVRQAGGEVSVEPFGDVEALQLAENIEGETYITRVYCYDGYIRELFSSLEDEMLPEDGELVFPAQAMAMANENGILRICVTDAGGQTAELFLAGRGREEAAP